MVWNKEVNESGEAWSDTGWEEFITGTTIGAVQDVGPVGTQTEVDTTTNPPYYTHTDAFLSNYNNTGDAAYETALYSRGYNLIYNNYFKDEDDIDIDINGTTYQQAYHLRNMYNEMRDSTASFQTYAEVEDISGTDYVGAQSMRDAMRRQRFAERREMFGDRYIDVLRSYGVRTNFNMLERPEPLGKSRHVVSFTDIPATADSANSEASTTVGDLAGHGIVGLHHRMPRKTFNEHGYLHGYIVVRPSQFINTSSPNDAVGPATASDYWAPEWEAETAQEVRGSLISSGLTSAAAGYLPKFQELRKTNNFIQRDYGGESIWGNEWTLEQNITTADADDARAEVRKVVSTDYDDAFNDQSATQPHFRALIHNGITSYRLVGPQSRI